MCYEHENRGYWIGDGCNICKQGFKQPYCKECEYGKLLIYISDANI